MHRLAQHRQPIKTPSVSLAFRDLGLPEVIAFTPPANHASSRVLIKASFIFLRHVAEFERDQHVVTVGSWRDAV